MGRLVCGVEFEICGVEFCGRCFAFSGTSRNSSQRKQQIKMSDFAEKTEETPKLSQEEEKGAEGAEEGGEDSNANPEVSNFFPSLKIQPSI
jgi:hypothetical protein